MSDEKLIEKEYGDDDKIQYKEIGKVGYITLNNPDKMNAINMDMVYVLLKLLHEIENDSKVRCLVIKSAGDRVFSAGWDLSLFKQVSQETIDNLLNYGAMISRTIYFMKKPVIVQIQGPAVGMGTIISLAADFRIAAKNEKIFFQLPELEIGPGIFPATGPTVGAVTVLGPAHAKEMLLTAKKVPLEEFNQWGGITEIIDPPEKLAKKVKKFARTLGRKSGTLLNLTNAAINIMGNRIAKDCWDLENEMAVHYFNGMMGKEVPPESEFVNKMWKKYGTGTAEPPLDRSP